MATRRTTTKKATEEHPPLVPQDEPTSDLPPPDQTPPVSPSGFYCSNGPEPATWKTTWPGANVDYFCDIHADLIYPTHVGLERLDAAPAQ
jgi:hypothetical protein